ncbi:unnamed protein product [Calypogeia fissa]
MARMVWMQTAVQVQAHSPISRQLAPTSSSLVESVLLAGRRTRTRSSSISVSTSSSQSCPSSPSSSSKRPSSCSSSSSYSHDGRIDAALKQKGASDGLFPVQNRFRWFSTPIRVSHGVERSHISTVAARASAGSEVGVGSETKNRDREILVQHLLVKEGDVQLLIELQRQIAQEGLDLSDLAEEHSTCPSKAQGGMIGWIKLGQTDPAFEKAAFEAPLNKVVRVKTKHGLHLVQVLNERKAHFLQILQVEQLHELMQDPTFLEESQLIDVREPNEIATAAIRGFEAYPLSEFGKWAPTIADDLDPEKDTYVLCHHGMRSMQAANWLQSQGFKRLYNIAGGIHAYSTRVDSSIPTY